jgi:EmrB/QacA subfamily drug resistance transporter
MAAVTNRFTTNSSTGFWILFSTILASSMAFIDSSALNVALNALQQDLGATAVDLIWIVNSYLLFLASLILIGGSLGDQFGRVRIFRIGIIIFALSSLASGLAPTPAVLIIGRAVKGLGAALMVPGSLAIISALFEDSERGKAIGIWSAASTITTVGGPFIGGIAVDQFTWRLVFFINLPLALLALYGLTKVPENKNENSDRHIDFLGAFLVVLGLAGLTYGLVTVGERGADPLAIGAVIVGVISLIAFVLVESRIAHPMVDLRLFRSRAFSGANVMTAFLYGALGGALLFLPLNLTQIQGYSASLTGLTLAPFGIILAVLSPWAGILVDRFGPRFPLTVGPAIVGVGFALMGLNGITNGPSDYWTTFFPAIVVMGIGMGITVAPLTATVMGSVPSSQAGVASGINNAVTRSAQVLATAVLGAVALAVFSGALAGRAAAMELPPEPYETLMESSTELGNTTVPEGLNDSMEAMVQREIDMAFVDMFRVLTGIAAVMAWISAILAALIVRTNNEPEEKRKVQAAAEF